jgi:hypothetical protein
MDVNLSAWKELKDFEKFFVAVSLQDQVNQADLDFKVEIT